LFLLSLEETPFLRGLPLISFSDFATNNDQKLVQQYNKKKKAEPYVHFALIHLNLHVNTIIKLPRDVK
jgi:hypothetical protein